jgi:hypothetical protein
MKIFNQLLIWAFLFSAPVLATEGNTSKPIEANPALDCAKTAIIELTAAYGTEKLNYSEFSEYSNNLEEIGFTPELPVDCKTAKIRVLIPDKEKQSFFVLWSHPESNSFWSLDNEKVLVKLTKSQSEFVQAKASASPLQKQNKEGSNHYKKIKLTAARESREFEFERLRDDSDFHKLTGDTPEKSAEQSPEKASELRNCFRLKYFLCRKHQDGECREFQAKLTSFEAEAKRDGSPQSVQFQLFVNRCNAQMNQTDNLVRSGGYPDAEAYVKENGP